MDVDDRPLCQRHDVAMLDLDGVVYVGPDAVPGAAGHLADAREAGLRLAFVTNNASRPPSAVSQHLRALGIDAHDDDVVTSAQAAARVLHQRLGDGARVALLGGEGLQLALEAVGLVPVEVGQDAAALVSGYGPEVRWREVMLAGVLVRDGLWWVASNTDRTIPTSYGTAPGHGVLVDTLQRFTGVDPVVAGKPAPPLLEETMRRLDARRPLMVGDRLDTDIEGARAVGVDSLLVMTGVTGMAELVAATPDQRPTHLAADLGGLLEPPGEPAGHDGGWSLGGWTCDAHLHVTGSGTTSDWWRVVAAAAWSRTDAADGGEVPDASHLSPPSAS